MIQVIGIDNKEYKLKLIKTCRASCSEYHLRARKLLKELFPIDIVFEEVSLPGSSNKRALSADFYIHSIRLMIEVQGQQHYEKVSFFSKSDIEFNKLQRRDADKAAWCKINSITLIKLPYSETDDEWRNRIENRS